MDKIKAVFIAIIAAITSWMGALFIPFLVLVGLNLTDYATGLLAAEHREQKISSDKGIRGIRKKVGMWILVAIGAVLDWFILYLAGTVGILLPFKFVVAHIVIAWLISNELISLLENLIDMGVPMPPFMLPLVRRIIGEVEKQVDVNATQEVEHSGNH